MLTVEEARERTQLMGRIHTLEAQGMTDLLASAHATNPCMAKTLADHGQALLDSAGELREQYCQRYPNCLSKHLF